MSKNSTFRDSHTDWERLNVMEDENIDLSEIPEITEKQMAGAILRVNGRPVPRGKERVSLLLDNAIIAYFKSQTDEGDYSSLINDALKASIHHQNLETLLRRVLREELQVVGS